MKSTRREMLIASLGVGLGAAAMTLLAGCVNTPPTTIFKQPKSIDPKIPPGKVIPPAGPTPTNPNLAVFKGLDILPRSRWTKTTGPISNKIYALNGIKHITVHHEGWTEVDFEDEGNTIERLERIRGGHTRSKRNGGRGWSDIGYHFIIDRAGRIWEARNLKYQGAHVESCNENNLGIMCLGNFEKQSPSAAQLTSLARALKIFKAYYKVPMSEIFTHQEWKKRCSSTSTECPGKNLQNKMASIRQAKVIG